MEHRITNVLLRKTVRVFTCTRVVFPASPVASDWWQRLLAPEIGTVLTEIKFELNCEG